VEDRLDPGLYLEMTDAPAAEYSRTRVPHLLACPGVRRATWWENVAPGRTDLPRVLDEFSLLGVYEVDDTFWPPGGGAPGAPGYHFRRYPRPAQGHLSAKPTIGLSLVLISPRADDAAQALRDWADFIHIRHIAEVGVPGFGMITPYENVSGGDPRFLHFYEMDTDDPEGAFQAMPKLVMEHLGGGFGTPAFDAWANHDALKIIYVNSFRRLGTSLA
jgi:hypothetical protein